VGLLLRGLKRDDVQRGMVSGTNSRLSNFCSALIKTSYGSENEPIYFCFSVSKFSVGEIAGRDQAWCFENV